MNREESIEKFIEDVDRLAAILESRSSVVNTELRSGFGEETREQKDASALVKNEDFRKFICPILKGCGGSFREIAKVISPFLLSHTTSVTASTALVVIGGTTLTIPLTTVYTLAIALAIAGAGVTGLCNDYDKSSE